MKAKWSVIDTEGREWPHGKKYGWITDAMHGWIAAAEEHLITDLIPLADLSQVVHLSNKESANWMIWNVLSPDLCVGRFREDGGPGKSVVYRDPHVWSISENRMLIPPCRAVLRYLPHLGCVSLITQDDHLQLRDLENRVVEDFGRIPHDFHPIFDSPVDFFWNAPAELVIPKEVGGETLYTCLNLETGKEYGGYFRGLSSVHEGMRFMIRPDWSVCFVDGNNEPLFDLPEPESVIRWLECHCKMPDPVFHLTLNAFDEMKKFYCSNGRILVARQTPEGKDTCYLIDKEGNMCLPPGKFDKMFSLGENRYAVQKRQRLAIANEKGELLTDYIYNTMGYDSLEIGSFSCGRCTMTKKVKSRYLDGCIDVDCNEVIPFETNGRICMFFSGYAVKIG